MIDRFFSPYLQRLLLRLGFAALVIVWKILAKPGQFTTSLWFLGGLFLFFAVAVYAWERGWRGARRELGVFTYVDIAFAGAFIRLSGGAEGEFYLILYFIVAMRAPYLSWLQTVMIPGVSTIAYLAAVGQTGRDDHWFDIMVRIALLWFLAVLLRLTGLKTFREKEKASKLADQLSTTHSEVRRYTAALEKANAEKEARLAQITLLHRFVMEVRGYGEYDVVYQAVLGHVGEVCEAPWIFLLHRGSASPSKEEVRAVGGPPAALLEKVREAGMDPGCGSDGDKVAIEVEDAGKVELRYFIRCHEERSSVTLVLAYPSGGEVLLESQVQVLSTLMDTVEMELELLRLRRDLADSHRKLSESNRHLVRLQEFQHELNTAFLAEEDLSAVIQSAHEIMAKELFELDRLNLFLPSAGGTMLQCRTSVGIGDYPQEKIAVPLDHRGGAISLAYRERKTIFHDGREAVPDVLRVAEPYSSIPAIRSRIFVIVPLLNHRGEVLGVIGADRKHTHKPIPEETVKMLEYFAHHLAMVLSVYGMRGKKPEELSSM